MRFIGRSLLGIFVLHLLCRIRTRSTATRDRNLQFPGTVSTGFLSIFSSGFFSPFSGFIVQFSEEMAHKSGENCPISGRKKSVESCHVSGCHGFFFFRFGRPQVTDLGVTGLDFPGSSKFWPGHPAWLTPFSPLPPPTSTGLFRNQILPKVLRGRRESEQSV